MFPEHSIYLSYDLLFKSFRNYPPWAYSLPQTIWSVTKWIPLKFNMAYSIGKADQERWATKSSLCDSNTWHCLNHLLSMHGHSHSLIGPIGRQVYAGKMEFICPSGHMHVGEVHLASEHVQAYKGCQISWKRLSGCRISLYRKEFFFRRHALISQFVLSLGTGVI